MGHINVEVKVMRGKAPVLFTWWNKDDQCVDACLVSCQCQGFKLEQCKHLHVHEHGPEQQTTIPSSSVHALGDMEWAAKFAGALEASEIITIPNGGLETCSIISEKVLNTEKLAKVKKKGTKKENVRKSLSNEKMVFDVTKAFIDPEAQVHLKQYLPNDSLEELAFDVSVHEAVISSKLQLTSQNNDREKCEEEKSNEELIQQRSLDAGLPASLPGQRGDSERNAVRAVDNLSVVGCLEETIQICGLKESEGIQSHVEINRVNINESSLLSNNKSPLSPKTFTELQPVRDNVSVLQDAGQPSKELPRIELTRRQVNSSENSSQPSIQTIPDLPDNTILHVSSTEGRNTLENRHDAVSTRTDTNLMSAMSLSDLDQSSSLFRGPLFPGEQHPTTCVSQADINASQISFVGNAADINLSDVHQVTIPSFSYPPNGQLTPEDEAFFDTLRGFIDGPTKSSLNPDSETGMENDQDDIDTHQLPLKNKTKISQAMADYLAHKEEEYKKKYKKYQNDPNSAFVLCELCGAALTNKSIKRHMESIHASGERERSHKCETCGKRFLYVTNLKRHLLIHTGVRFKCHYCDKTYKQAWNRQVHEKTHLDPSHISSTSVRKPPSRSPLHSSNNSVVCEICGKTLKQQSMKLHMDSHNEKMSTCKICGKTVKSGSKYQHAKLHTNNKNHVCSYCSAKFYFKSALVAHMRKHTKERPIPCRYCDKTFPRYESRSNHERLHTGERPYQCDLCQKDWRDRPTYMQHMQKHHPGAPLMYKKKQSVQKNQNLSEFQAS